MSTVIYNYLEDGFPKNALLASLIPIKVIPHRIVKQEGLSMTRSAIKWFEENVGYSIVFQTVVGSITIDRRSIKDSLNHKYGQRKLDSITSLAAGFGHSVYLTSLPDYDNRDITNHYFVYPIDYGGELCYVLCRTRQDSNISRLYIHEVFPEAIIKGDTLQTAAGNDQYRRGIALYGSILREVLLCKDTDSFENSNNTASSKE